MRIIHFLSIVEAFRIGESFTLGKLLVQQICCYFIMSCQVRLLDKRLSIAELTEQQLKRNVEFEQEKKLRTGITILYCNKFFIINLQNDYL
jgi:hypothetical protein